MDEDQLNKLYVYLGKRFGEIEAKMDAETDERRDQISKVQSTVDAMDTRLGNVEEQLERLDERLEVLEERAAGIELVVGGLDKKVDALADGQRQSERRLDRHERWNRQVADHVGLKLDFS